MDKYISVKLVSHNLGVSLVVLAVKTSAGKVKEKDMDYYLRDYVKEKPEEAKEWLLKAAKNYPSVLEHVVFTFMIEGISRVTSHQLVRHRLASYTQESQRYSLALAFKNVPKEYLEKTSDKITAVIEWMSRLKEQVKQGNIKEVVSQIEPLVVIPEKIKGGQEALKRYLGNTICSIKTYLELVHAGIPYEDARYLLPQAMRTRILMTVNLRELLHILKLRLSPHAQWEIREMAYKMREEAKKAIPFLDELLELSPVDM